MPRLVAVPETWPLPEDRRGTDHLLAAPLLGGRRGACGTHRGCEAVALLQGHDQDRHVVTAPPVTLVRIWREARIAQLAADALQPRAGVFAWGAVACPRARRA